MSGVSSSSSVPLSSSSSSSFGAVSSLADHQARLLGLSSEYQSLARWFLSSGGSDFAALVRSSFPHLLPDLSRDFTSGSSLFLTTLRSAPPLPAPPVSSASLAPPFASVPPPPGFPPLPPHPSLGSGGSHLVPGLGVGVPPTSGVPPYSVTSAAFAYPAAPPAPSLATAPAPQPPAAVWPQPYPPAPFAHSSHGAAADPYVDDDDPGAVHDPLDPSAPPLGLESVRSEYRRMIDYICGLFPQAVGVLPSAPPPHALFESFFAPAAQATPSVQLNWFDRVRTSLFEADSRVASLLSSGRPERLVVPTRATSYAVKGDCTLGHAVPVNESLLSHFDRPLCPSLQLGLTISGLLGFVRLQDFTLSDPALFNQLVTALSKSLAHQAQISASHTAFLCHRRREFYLSPLILVMYRSDQCSLPLLCSRILCFVRMMFLACWKRPALHRHSSRNKPW